MERGQGWDHGGYDGRDDGAADHGHDWSGHDARGHGLSEPAHRPIDDELPPSWRAHPAAPRLRLVRPDDPADARQPEPGGTPADGEPPPKSRAEEPSHRSRADEPAPQSRTEEPAPQSRAEQPAAEHRPPEPPPSDPIAAPDATAIVPARGRVATRLAHHRGRATAWWRAAPDNLRGSVYFLASFFAFAIMTVSVKAMGTRVPLVEVILLRQIIMTALLAPAFAGNWKATLSTRRLDLQLLRGVLSVFGMFAGLSAVQHIPLAEATAIGFSQVLFVTVLAVVILKETVGWRRWTATLIGFVGVLVMLKPTGDGFGFYAMLSLAGAAAGSLITITVRKLSNTERTETILFYQAVVFLAVCIVPTVMWWETPTLVEWGFILLIGLGGTGGQYLITKAYQTGEAAALAPLDFSRLIISAALGYLIFSEIPQITTVIGAAIVIGATLYTMKRNSVRKSEFPPDPRSGP